MFNRNQNVKYIVTAHNKLSGEREVISSPRSLELTKAMMQRRLKEVRYKRHQPYTNLRIEESITQLKIW